MEDIFYAVYNITGSVSFKKNTNLTTAAEVFIENIKTNIEA